LIKKNELKPDKKLAAVCGLFCSACRVYLADQLSEENKKKLAEQFGISAEQFKCDGCRSDNVFIYCKTCEFTKCAKEKGIEFCGECNEYPCSPLVEFQKQFPHRLELWNSHQKIKQDGWESWFNEMSEFYACPECDTINTAYMLKCENCGTEPSNKFTEKHFDSIKTFLTNKQK